MDETAQDLARLLARAGATPAPAPLPDGPTEPSEAALPGPENPVR